MLALMLAGEAGEGATGAGGVVTTSDLLLE